ncbi:homeobox leucine zipper protein [Thalictrum thalictroides]|uniref:Homeobox leucine zipper protein n=1 Tax=Thalictrum thalictroides TaxID=46969 RepID=A0A7J6XGQ7_THATH|nr:homeobox leucine zipper protein [Thalictrum thalictroides]
MARKRQKPYFTQQNSSSNYKKPRYKPPSSSSSSYQPETPVSNEESNKPTNTRQSSSMVVVNGLSFDCSILNLKSRFEMYGDIARTRIDNGIGYINFRSKDSAEAAIAASLDPSFGITIDSQKVHVSWPNDPPPEWKEGVRVSVRERLSSKLLLPEVPLSRHGRGKRLRSDSLSPKDKLDSSNKPRNIIAYDDLF